MIRRSCSAAAAAAAVLAASFASTGSSGAHAAGVSAALTETRGLLRVDGAGIAYRELNRTARGTALLLIVGYGSTMAEWDPALIRGLATRRRLIMFDNRGAGDSTGSVKHLSVHVMAGDAAGVIHGLKLGRVDVLGWSMGGFIAQELTLDSPALVRRLILASTDPGSPRATPGKPAVIRALTNPATTVAQLLPILFPRDQATAAKTWLTAIASQPGVTSRDFTVSPAATAAQKTATHSLWLGRGEGTYARLSAIRARTLVAYGTKDVVVPSSSAQLLFRHIPHAVSSRVRDAGHAFLFQDPVSVARAFTAFLASRAAHAATRSQPHPTLDHLAPR